MAPQTQKQWTVQGTGSFDNLKLNEKASVPKIGDNDVLVKCELYCSFCVTIEALLTFIQSRVLP